jgi:hypothetical protein
MNKHRGLLRLFRKNSTQYKVFQLLRDQRWHCRECEGKSVSSGQYAGGGGIQGLQRGTKSRPGLVIIQERRSCKKCARDTRHDRWTGGHQEANAAATLPGKLQERIFKLYNYTDVIESRQRPQHELIIDHRFPMERWGRIEPAHNRDMSEGEILRRFQLLKKDVAGNHNLLKSRACERCVRQGMRGTPFGIRFWYHGHEKWPDVPRKGGQAEEGCVGCGWYDFARWRDLLNSVLLKRGRRPRLPG